MGYSNEQSQLISVPPYVVGCLFTIAGGALADRMKKRGWFMISFNLVAIIGFVMLIATDNPRVQYAGTFFAVSGYV
jgi:nitrate/nitrite transporter NarK